MLIKLLFTYALISLLFNISIFAENHWQSQSSGTTNILYSVFFTDALHGTVVGNNGTILHTTNGGFDWVAQSSGTTNRLLGVAFTDENNGTVVGYQGTILHTTNGGSDWIPQTNGISNNSFFGVCFTDANNGTVTDQDGGILHTTNGGTDWLTQISSGSGSLYHLAFADVNNGTIVSQSGVVYRTTNGGSNWTSQIVSSPVNSGLFGVCFTDLNNGTIVGGDLNASYGLIYRTTDGGTSWTQQSAGSALTLMDVSFGDVNNGTAVGFFGTILQTTNAGADWIPQPGETPNHLLSVCFTDSKSGTAVGFSGTILRYIPQDLLPVELTALTSVSNGRTIRLNWGTKTEKNSNKFNVERKTITSDWKTVGSVYASGLSNSPKQYSFTDSKLQSGKYQYRLKMIDNDGTFNYSNLIETAIDLPAIFDLSQNYPNPFNPSTKINYTIPFDSKVTLEVYNLTGNKIAQLVNDDKPAGYYSVDFNSSLTGSNLPSGVYFYRINASNKLDGTNFSSIKKMVLLK